MANNQNNPGEVNPNIVGSDISGQVFEARNNLIEDPTGHNVTNGVDGNIVGVDPLLGNLADNGGDTPTYAPLAGSPVIDAGDNIFVSSDTDQRGEGFLRIVNGTVDIGAVEVQDVQQGDLYLRSIAGDDPLTGGADRDIL
ncbi:MAG: choice-of-anchor Q domain-containing protein [Xenococcaceae cyanobacterium]